MARKGYAGIQCLVPPKMGVLGRKKTARGTARPRSNSRSVSCASPRSPCGVGATGALSGAIAESTATSAVEVEVEVAVEVEVEFEVAVEVAVDVDLTTRSQDQKRIAPCRKRSPPPTTNSS